MLVMMIHSFNGAKLHVKYLLSLTKATRRVVGWRQTGQGRRLLGMFSRLGWVWRLSLGCRKGDINRKGEEACDIDGMGEGSRLDKEIELESILWSVSEKREKQETKEENGGSKK